MNRKQLAILFVLVVVVGGAGLLTYKTQKAAESSGNAGVGKKLLPDFPVNDVAHISIRQGGSAVSLVKKDDVWKVAERHDYPANFSSISELLLKLRDLKAGQVEQAGPSQMPRLQLAANGQGTNAPLVVELKGANDKTINTLLLGKMHLSSRGAAPMGEGDAGFPDGRYVKVGADSAEVAVVSNPFENIEPKPEPWLSKDFFKVEKPRSIEVTFPAATNSWKLTRETETSEWKLAGAKADEPLDSSKAAGISNPLNAPAFVDVLQGTATDESGTNPPAIIRIETFDNFAYTLKAGPKTNDDMFLKVAVSAQIPKERVAGKDEKPEDKTRLDREFKDRQQKLEEKLKQEQSLEPWTYRVSNWTLEPLLKERSQLLVEKKEELKADGAATNAVIHSGEPTP
jgi:Domain of unknown function (DUF4340)